MPLGNFIKELDSAVADLERAGTRKGHELVITEVVRAREGRGPRYRLAGHGNRDFIRMNSNSYLGLGFHEALLRAEEEASRRYGVGPGSVRFISGSFEPHVQLEARLAELHGRDACMITSAAYTSVLGVLVTLTTPETILISDELNHNSIINAMRLARPKDKKVFPHLDMASLEHRLEESVGQAEHVIVVTDGVFSMRGDLAPLDQISTIIERYNDRFPRDIVLVVDDSHGVGALGQTGRGTEEYTGYRPGDILIATLGKAFGVNGGYAVSHRSVIDYLREKNPLYIYTNPITAGEAAAALAAVDLLTSSEGQARLSHLREMTARFEQGLLDLGHETIRSPHPVVPLLVRDTERTGRLVRHLRENGVLATGLGFPVVPRGDDLIRFQICADHTAADIDQVLEVLSGFHAG